MSCAKKITWDKQKLSQTGNYTQAIHKAYGRNTNAYTGMKEGQIGYFWHLRRYNNDLGFIHKAISQDWCGTMWDTIYLYLKK